MISMKSDHIKDISLLIPAFQPHMLEVLYKWWAILKSCICKLCLMSCEVGATVQLADTDLSSLLGHDRAAFRSDMWYWKVCVLWICLVMMAADYFLTHSSIWPSEVPIVSSPTTTCAVLFLERSWTLVVVTFTLLLDYCAFILMAFKQC